VKTRKRREKASVPPSAQPLPRKNSPQAWLLLAGTLSEEEAEAILDAVRTESRRIEPELFERKG